MTTTMRLTRDEGRMWIGKAPKKAGRYRVAPKEQRTVDGIVFDSKAEATYYAELKVRERLGEIARLTLQHEMPITINGREYTTFTCDFRFYDDREKRIVYHEVKSEGTRRERDYKLRRLAAELYYSVEIVEVVR